MKACVAITSYFGQSFVLGYKWNSKKRLLNDQVRSITHEVDLLALTHEALLVGTERNE